MISSALRTKKFGLRFSSKWARLLVRRCLQQCVRRHDDAARRDPLDLNMPAPTHGKYTTPEYRTWIAMKMRCNSPTASNYARYGALGIRVCEQWLNDFEAFYRDVGSRPSAEHSIDRIDAKGNYEPGNCRWATRDEQRNNRRNTVYVIYR